MSTIGLKYHNEDIHCIIHKPQSPIVKSPRYKSKWKVTAQSEVKKYNGHQTFGLAHYEAPESKNFLKKKKAVAVPSAKVQNKKESKSTVRGKDNSIPKPSFEKSKGKKKNFVKENVKKVLTLQPKVPVPRRVETPRGTVKDLAHLLQMIKIRESEDYGKIPQYLCERKMKLLKDRERQELERQAYEKSKEKMGTSENVIKVDEETRQRILDGLKENWNELSKQFLKLPVMTDTWPKIKRKMCLEKEIEQLEKDIKLVERHPYIYIEKTGRNYSETSVQEELQQSQEEPKEEMESEIKEELVAESQEKLKAEEPVEETTEEKREEDKEINIYNY